MYKSSQPHVVKSITRLLTPALDSTIWIDRGTGFTASKCHSRANAVPIDCAWDWPNQLGAMAAANSGDILGDRGHGQVGIDASTSGSCGTIVLNRQ